MILLITFRNIKVQDQQILNKPNKKDYDKKRVNRMIYDFSMYLSDLDDQRLFQVLKKVINLI